MMKKSIMLIFVLLNLVSAKDLPSFIQQWQGIYSQINSKHKLSFKISNHCFKDDLEGMGEFVCEIGYAEDGHGFDDWHHNFYTERANDMNYAITRIIEIKSSKQALIKVFSMEYANDFCTVEVQKQNETIKLEAGKCKIDDFILNSNIFGTYKKIF